MKKTRADIIGSFGEIGVKTDENDENRPVK
jgi:hypothetical protein